MIHNRRKFIKKSVAALSIPLISPFDSPFGILKQVDLNGVRIGVVGTGSRGMGLIKILTSIDDVSVTAVCDTLPFRLQEASSIVPKARSYKNYEDLFIAPDVDAVIISTPLNTHASIASAAVDAGLHIYCEKTLVKGDEATLALVQKVRKNHKKVFQTGHQYHSSRLYSHIVGMIQDGKIGTVGSVEAQWNRNGNWRRPVPDPRYERQINWRMYRDYSYGLLAELSSHQIDFVNWVLKASPERVIGFGDVSYWKDGRETYDNTQVIYAYPQGVKASFTCLTSNAKEGYQIKVKGDQGTIVIGPTAAWEYPEAKYQKEYGEVDGVSGATSNWVAGKGFPINYQHLEPTRQALIDFRDAIINGTAPLSDIHTGAKTALAVDMGIRAMDTQKCINWKSSYNY